MSNENSNFFFKMKNIEKKLAGVCHYIKNAVISKDEKGDSIALIFPDKKLLTHPDYKLSPAEGCFCPRSLDELGKCLSGCIKSVNSQLDGSASAIKSAVIINVSLPSEKETTNSADAVIKKYIKLLRDTKRELLPDSADIYFVKNEY